MKIIVAIDSFKGSLSSSEAGEAVAEGIRDVLPAADVMSLPLADGGEGTVEALVTATGGRLRSVQVTGPLGQSVIATYGVLGDGSTAVIEVAAACGLPLVPLEQRNPLLATSRGVGELIIDALKLGCRDFVIGLGGSATNDAGLGMLEALGCRFLNENGVDAARGGQALTSIQAIDRSGMLAELRGCRFRIACDVDNPLYGSEGAAYVFGPQKGADPKMVQQLDAGLRHFAHIAGQELGTDISNFPGAGAAGGLGAAFVGFLSGELKSGVELVMESLELEKQLNGAQFVITGEGSLDGQTSRGKAPLGIAKLAARRQIPVIALAGCVDEESPQLNDLGVTAYFPIIGRPMTLEEAMEPEQARKHLRATSRQLMLLIKAVSPAFK